MPYIRALKIDGLHDFIFLGFAIFNEHIRSHSVDAYLLAAIGLALITVLSRWRLELKQMILSILGHQTYILLLFFVVLISFSLLIDLEIVRYEPLFMLEELFEADAAVALLFSCLSLTRTQP